MQSRLYLVSYDISDPKRWRRVFKALKRRGAWQQLSAFACRLTPRAARELEQELLSRIDAATDRLMIVDLGPGADAEARIRRHGEAEPFPSARFRLF